MAAYIAIFLTLINLVLLITILIKFKKLFSTDSIIEKTRFQMNKMIRDIDTSANRDIELMNESTKRIKALMTDADRKMESFREASELLRNMIAEVERKNVTAVQYETKNVVDIKTPGQRKKERVSKLYNIDPDSSYEIKKNEQGLLFDDESEQHSPSILKDETKITAEGTAFKEVPLIITKVYDDSIVKAEKKSLSDKVHELFDQGMQVEEIANELSCSVTEVQLIIDLG